MWVCSLRGPQARALDNWRPRRPRSGKGPVLSPVLVFWRARPAPETPRLPAAQSSLLLRPVVLPLRHSYLIALPRLSVGGGGLAQPRDTHGSVPQIQPAGIWLMQVGASYSVAIPANRRPGCSGEAERETPRELEIEESMMEKRWQRRGLARNLGRDSNMKEHRP